MSIFLSRYTNKIDKKGRVSVPSLYRTLLSEEKFQGIIVYPSFKNDCIEACSMSRLEKTSELIYQLDPYSEERDAFETAVMGESVQLQFDNEGRVVLPVYMIESLEIEEQVCFVGKGLVFEIWNPEKFEDHLVNARSIAKAKRFILKNQLETNK